MRLITELGQVRAILGVLVSDVPAFGLKGRTPVAQGKVRDARTLVDVAAMALLAALIAVCFYVKPAETLPGGFSDTKVSDSHLPTALDFAPDGRTLVTSKTGELYVCDGSGDRLANPALDLPLFANSERGLLGVAVDPDFASRRNYRYPGVA